MPILQLNKSPNDTEDLLRWMNGRIKYELLPSDGMPDKGGQWLGYFEAKDQNSYLNFPIYRSESNELFCSIKMDIPNLFDLILTKLVWA